MRVAYLTAGAGEMYCGSCMRDNTLAAALIRKRRDLILIPVYSPIRTDETDVSARSVVFGGINVYLQQKLPFLRHLPRLADRILDHPALLRFAMRGAGSTSPAMAAPYTLSILRGEAGLQRREVEKVIEHLRQLKPDLVHLPDALFVGLAETIRRRIRVPVVCTLTGEDVFLDRMPAAERAEAHRLIRSGANHVDAFLSVSQHYSSHATEHFGIPAERIHRVPLGISIRDIGTNPSSVFPDSHREGHPTGGMSAAATGGSAGDRPLTIGYLARICHEKGLHLLCEAFGMLHARGRPCRLVVAGTLGRSDRRYLEGIRANLRKAKLSEWVEIRGEVDRAGKFAMLRSLDIFSVPTIYREAKGLYILEALSQGVPVVQPAHGSFPELIESTGGGLMFAPADASALASAIERLMDDGDLRQRLGQTGRDAVRARHTDDVMAEAAWSIFERVAASRRGGAE